jgi:hypothetical protein
VKAVRFLFWEEGIKNRGQAVEDQGVEFITEV